MTSEAFLRRAFLEMKTILRPGGANGNASMHAPHPFCKLMAGISSLCGKFVSIQVFFHVLLLKLGKPFILFST